MCLKQCKWAGVGQGSGKKVLANVQNTVQALMSAKSRHAMILSKSVVRLRDRQFADRLHKRRDIATVFDRSHPVVLYRYNSILVSL